MAEYGDRIRENPCYKAPNGRKFPFDEKILNQLHVVEFDNKHREFKLEHECTFDGYSSTHYIIASRLIKGVHFELQTRTIAEDVLGEVSHNVRYPDFTEDGEMLKGVISLSQKLEDIDRLNSQLKELRNKKDKQQGDDLQSEVIKINQEHGHLNWDQMAHLEQFDQVVKQLEQIALPSLIMQRKIEDATKPLVKQFKLFNEITERSRRNLELASLGSTAKSLAQTTSLPNLGTAIKYAVKFDAINRELSNILPPRMIGYEKIIMQNTALQELMKIKNPFQLQGLKIKIDEPDGENLESVAALDSKE